MRFRLVHSAGREYGRSMKAIPLAPVACILVLLGLAAHLSLRAEDEKEPEPRKAPARQKWEHLALPRDASKPLSDPEFAKQINGFGTEGWELVTVLNFAKDGTTTKTVYYFKRPLD